MEVGSLAEITSANTDTDVYKRTTARKFWLRNFIISNRSAALARVRLWDGASAGGRTKIDVLVAASATFAVNDLKGISFEYGNVVGQSDNVPVSIQVGGEEE